MSESTTWSAAAAQPSSRSGGTSNHAVAIHDGPRQQRKRSQRGLKVGSLIATDGIPVPAR